MPGFPTRLSTKAADYVPARVDRRWQLKQKLIENEEMLLALPVGPLLELNYRQATTGKRYVWDDINKKAIPFKRKIIRYGADKLPMLTASGELIFDEVEESLDAAEQDKLISSLLDRILPAAKSIDRSEMAKTIDADTASLTDEDIKTMNGKQLREHLAKLEAPVEPEAQPEDP